MEMAPSQKSERICPACGRSISWGANSCQYCGHDLRSLSHEFTKPRQDKKRSRLTTVIVVIVLVAVVAMFIGAFVLSPKAVRADLSYSARNVSGLGSFGYISVSGVIYNYGNSDVNCTLHLRVFDGYIWHDYLVPLGVVHAGGEHWLNWSADFDPMNEDNVQVEHTLIMG